MEMIEDFRCVNFDWPYQDWDTSSFIDKDGKANLFCFFNFIPMGNIFEILRNQLLLKWRQSSCNK